MFVKKIILNPYEDKEIDINHRSNEYFPKSINTKPINVQGKSYSDRTNKHRSKDTNTHIERHKDTMTPKHRDA